ncbi:SH3 domain-containing protein [Streptomyces flaveolus]|uniref:SH3 domain-containing protein n=1 Tax=Streptomyces flaveolus TaxID=67297 RepID=A0ABV1VJ48_9ACTN
MIKAGTVLVSLLLAVSGGAGHTGAAAVLKPRACNTDGAAAQLHITARAVHLRSGKGTSHTSRALLTRGTDFYAECWGRSTGHGLWAYGKVMSGPHNDERGWVSGNHVATGYRH